MSYSRAASFRHAARSSRPAAPSASTGTTSGAIASFLHPRLARRRVRYKQTVIGVAWAFIRPFLTMVVFTVVFGHLAKLPTDGDVPYALWCSPACCRGRCSRRC